MEVSYTEEGLCRPSTAPVVMTDRLTAISSCDYIYILYFTIEDLRKYGNCTYRNGVLTNTLKVTARQFDKYCNTATSNQIILYTKSRLLLDLCVHISNGLVLVVLLLCFLFFIAIVCVC